MQSLKVRGPCRSLDFQTLLVLGPLQKPLLPFIFHGSVPLLVLKSFYMFLLQIHCKKTGFSNEKHLISGYQNTLRAVARGGGGLQPSQFLANQLSLSRPGGGTLFPPSTTSPPGFSDLATALTLQKIRLAFFYPS